MAQNSSNTPEDGMQHEPIVFIRKSDGSLELVGGWPMHTVINAHSYGLAGVTIERVADQITITIGDKSALYELVGEALSGGAVCDWQPRGGE